MTWRVRYVLLCSAYVLKSPGITNFHVRVPAHVSYRGAPDRSQNAALTTGPCQVRQTMLMLALVWGAGKLG